MRLLTWREAKPCETSTRCIALQRVGKRLGEIVIVLGCAVALACHFGAMACLKVLGGRIGLRLRRHQAQSILRMTFLY